MADEKSIVKYPYLGINYYEEKPYVVFFIDTDTGVVIHDETENEKIHRGDYRTDFAEEAFEVLPEDIVITMSN